MRCIIFFPIEIPLGVRWTRASFTFTVIRRHFLTLAKAPKDAHRELLRLIPYPRPVVPPESKSSSPYSSVIGPNSPLEVAPGVDSRGLSPLGALNGDCPRVTETTPPKLSRNIGRSHMGVLRLKREKAFSRMPKVASQSTLTPNEELENAINKCKIYYLFYLSFPIFFLFFSFKVEEINIDMKNLRLE